MSGLTYGEHVAAIRKRKHPKLKPWCKDIEIVDLGVFGYKYYLAAQYGTRGIFRLREEVADHVKFCPECGRKRP